MERRTLALWVLLVGLFLVTAYSPIVSVPFVTDDLVLIPSVAGSDNPHIGSHFTSSFFSNTSGPNTHYYRPLVTLSYAVEDALWPGSSALMHITNTLFHLATAAMVFYLARVAGAAFLAALLAAAAFGALPRLTEAVGIVSGRTDVLATLGALGCIALHRSGSGRLAWRVGSALSLGAALLCKEVALAALPALLLLREPGVDWRRHARDLVPVTATAVLYLIVRSVVVSPSDFAGPSWSLRFAFALQALGENALMLADPLRPRVRIGIYGLVDGWKIALGAATALAAAAVFLRLRSRPWERALLAMGACGIGLVLHLVPLATDAIAADRFLYLPAAAFAPLAALALTRIPVRWQTTAIVAASAMCLAMGTVTHLRLSGWSTERAFWEDVARSAPPGDGLPQRALATLEYRSGNYEASLAFAELALARSREIPVVPMSIARRREAFESIAGALQCLGREDEAVALLEMLVADRPDRPSLRAELARLHLVRLDAPAAERELVSALARQPQADGLRALLEGIRAARSELEEKAAVPTSPVHELERWSEISLRKLDPPSRERLWYALSQHPDAQESAIRRASLYLGVRGEPGLARRALSRWKEVAGDTPEIRSLEAMVAERLGVPAGHFRTEPTLPEPFPRPGESDRVPG
jgi:hypothetical protein